MIITDGVHLVSTISLAELHAFAESIGLKRHFFHGLRKKHPHYDLTTSSWVQKALEAGARKVGPMALIKKAYWSSWRKR